MREIHVSHGPTKEESDEWKENTEITTYFLDDDTGEVTEVVTNEYVNYRNRANDKTDEVSRRILTAEQIPQEVRDKIMAL